MPLLRVNLWIVLIIWNALVRLPLTLEALPPRTGYSLVFEKETPMKSVTLNAAPARNVLATILGVLLFSGALFAQGSFGRILGTVTDQTGAVLPGATVTV